jgi:hypothetical protein
MSQFLLTDEAAEFLRLKPGTLANWRIAGTGPPFVKVGRRVLYDRETLPAWAKSKHNTSTTEARS